MNERTNEWVNLELGWTCCNPESLVCALRLLEKFISQADKAREISLICFYRWKSKEGILGEFIKVKVHVSDLEWVKTHVPRSEFNACFSTGRTPFYISEDVWASLCTILAGNSAFPMIHIVLPQNSFTIFSHILFKLQQRPENIKDDGLDRASPSGTINWASVKQAFKPFQPNRWKPFTCLLRVQLRTHVRTFPSCVPSTCIY